MSSCLSVMDYISDDHGVKYHVDLPPSDVVNLIIIFQSAWYSWSPVINHDSVSKPFSLLGPTCMLARSPWMTRYIAI